MSDANDLPRSPIVNPLPSVVVVLAAAIVLIEILLAAGSRGMIGGPNAVGWRIDAIERFGFFPALIWTMNELQAWSFYELLRSFSYSLVHYNFTHMVFVVVFLLALGKLIAETLGPLAVLAIFFLSAAFGSLVFAVLSGSSGPLVGGFPAVYGLIGSYTFLLWVGYGATGENQWRAFTLIGVLLGLQLVFGLLFGSNRDWVAEVSGFLLGFSIAPFVSKGGLRRLLERLRQR